MTRPDHEEEDGLTTEALQAHPEQSANEDSPRGWWSVFGQARREEVEPVDAVVIAELEGIDLDQ